MLHHLNLVTHTCSENALISFKNFRNHEKFRARQLGSLFLLLKALRLFFLKNANFMNITLPIQDETGNLWSDWFSEQRFFLWFLLDLINENKSKKSWQC